MTFGREVLCNAMAMKSYCHIFFCFGFIISNTVFAKIMMVMKKKRNKRNGKERCYAISLLRFFFVGAVHAYNISPVISYRLDLKYFIFHQ